MTAVCVKKNQKNIFVYYTLVWIMFNRRTAGYDGKQTGYDCIKTINTCYSNNIWTCSMESKLKSLNLKANK